MDPPDLASLGVEDDGGLLHSSRRGSRRGRDRSVVPRSARKLAGT